MENYKAADARACQLVLFDLCKRMEQTSPTNSSFIVECQLFNTNIKRLEAYANDREGHKLLNTFAIQRKIISGLLITEAVVYTIGMVSLLAGTLERENKTPLYISISFFGIGAIVKLGSNILFHNRNMQEKKMVLKSKFQIEKQILDQFKTIQKLLKILSTRKPTTRKFKTRYSSYREDSLRKPVHFLSRSFTYGSSSSDEEPLSDSDSDKDERTGTSIRRKVEVTEVQMYRLPVINEIQAPSRSKKDIEKDSK